MPRAEARRNGGAGGRDAGGRDAGGRRALALGAGFVLALTAWRVAALALSDAELFVDEAQYWLWGQHLAAGYYSKPPLIGWLIRAATELAGSDTAFWVRLPAPLLHMATALVLGACAHHLHGPRAAAWTAAVYAALPMASLGSFVISTDTVMLPLLAAALLCHLRAIRRPGWGWALGAGALLGLAALAKYAALLLLPCAALAALLRPEARLRPAHAAAALVATLLVLAPNIAWNALHGATTLRHTAANADWQGALNPAGAVEFAVSQLAVFGPVPFAVLAALSWRAARGRAEGGTVILVALSAPIVALMTLQGLLSRANANWAVAAYAAGTLAVVPRLMAHRAWLWATQGLHVALALALTVMLLDPRTPAWRGEPLFARYFGQGAISRRIAETAAAEGLGTIVARDRGLSADLHHTLRGEIRRGALRVLAPTRPGFARSYYEQAFPVPPDLAEPALFAGRDEPAPCQGARPLAAWTPRAGAQAGHRIALWRAPPGCFAGGS